MDSPDLKKQIRIANLEPEEPVSEEPVSEEPVAPAARCHSNAPLVMVDGVERFKENPLVNLLIETSTLGLNGLMIAALESNRPDDYAHLMQLTGYSRGGWGELSCVSDARWASVPDMDEDAKSYEEGFRDGQEHTAERIQGLLRGDYDDY